MPGGLQVMDVRSLVENVVRRKRSKSIYMGRTFDGINLRIKLKMV